MFNSTPLIYKDFKVSGSAEVTTKAERVVMQLKLEMEQQTQQLENERELEDYAVRAAKEAEVSKARISTS